MIDAERAVADLTPERRKQIASDLANIVADYGQCAPVVVNPGWFAASLDRLNVAVPDGDEAAQVLGAECAALIDQFVDEPEGAGFFAFGALVALYYASCTVSGDPDGALNTVKRFLDLAGAADDDGETGLYDEAVTYVMTQLSAGRAELAARIAAHATSLTA